MKFRLKLSRSTNEDPPRFYKLVSKDKKTMKISEDAVSQSDFLRNLCFNSEVVPLTDAIPIDLFNSRALKMAIKWCELHKSQVPPKSFSFSKFMSVPPDDRQFFNMNGNDLLALIRIADFLGIRNLYYYGLIIVASMLENRSDEDILLIFRHGKTRLAALKLITLRPIYDLPKLRSFDVMSMKTLLLEDLFFFMKRPVILKMSLCSNDLFLRIKDSRREVTVATCSEDNKDNFTIGEIIELLLLEQMMDPENFHERFELDVSATQGLHFVIHYQSQSSIVHIHLRFYYTFALRYRQRKEFLEIDGHRFTLVKKYPKMYFYEDDNQREAAEAVYQYFRKLFHLEEKLPVSLPECEMYVERRREWWE